ncbi:MAG TPA: AraC family transcriptional regulator [Flavitalea sp.]|nr:AraC family transcriptional regulator [Flavitalea sp.]
MIRLERTAYLGTNRRSFSLDGIVVSETEYTKTVSEDWHYHVNNHITYILQGGNREQRKNDEAQVLPGKLLIYPSGLPHRNLNTAYPSKNINLEVDDEFLLRHNLIFSISSSVDLKFLLLKIYKECVISDNDSKASIQALVLNIFESLREGHEHISPKWVGVIAEVLHDRWNENVSLAELSHELKLHPVTVSKNFPKHFNCTLGEYSRKIKIDRAISLIRQSNRLLTEIALECGFFDQSHFIKTFKHITGFTPQQYRRL